MILANEVGSLKVGDMIDLQGDIFADFYREIHALTMAFAEVTAIYPVGIFHLNVHFVVKWDEKVIYENTVCFPSSHLVRRQSVNGN